MARFLGWKVNLNVLEIFLFKVEETFTVRESYGLVLTPGLADKVRIAKIGSRLKLIRPDKSIIEARIDGITFEGEHDIMIKGLHKEDVPHGTEVWLMD